MSLLRRGHRAERAGQPPQGWTDYLKQITVTQSAAGVAITPETAMRHAAVWGCNRVISGAVSTLPLDQFTGNGTRQRSLSPVLASPSDFLPPTAWRFAAVSSLVLRGNLYARLQFDRGLYPVKAELISPDAVSWRHDDDGILAPFIGADRQSVWPNGDLWHVPAFPLAGSPVGMNPIENFRMSIGAGLGALKFGNDFFASEAHPTAVLSTDHEVTGEKAGVIKQRFKDAVANREPAVLGLGFSYEAMQVNPTDSQFLDTMRYSAEQIAMIFGVQPEKIGASISGKSITYANRDQASIEFLTATLLPWLVRLEEAYGSLLPNPQSVKHNVDGLLRSDLKARYESYKLSADYEQVTGVPIVTNDEIRALENRDPLPEPESGDAEPVTESALEQAARTLQQIYLAVDVVISPEEARQMVTEAGFSLPGDLPDEGTQA